MSCGQDAGEQADGDGYYFGQNNKVPGYVYRQSGEAEMQKLDNADAQEQTCRAANLSLIHI